VRLLLHDAAFARAVQQKDGETAAAAAVGVVKVRNSPAGSSLQTAQLAWWPALAAATNFGWAPAWAPACSRVQWFNASSRINQHAYCFATRWRTAQCIAAASLQDTVLRVSRSPAVVVPPCFCAAEPFQGLCQCTAAPHQSCWGAAASPRLRQPHSREAPGGWWHGRGG
jgi:hypothetical protein